MLQSIHIKLLPSKLMLGLLGGVSIACCAIVLTLPILLYVKFIIIALIVISSAYFIARDALLLLPNSWKILEVNNKGELTMTNKSGQKFELTPASNSFIHKVFSMLNFKREGFNLAPPPVILFPNAKNTDELRHLRVWLRWFKHQDDLSVSDLGA
jgi:hypothetical protein